MSTEPSAPEEEVKKVVSKARPATVEDAPDSDDDARSEKTVEEPGEVKDSGDVKKEEGDAVSRAIAAAEKSVEPPHDWQAVWAPAQNGQHIRSLSNLVSV